jgi:hypothetical protein
LQANLGNKFSFQTHSMQHTRGTGRDGDLLQTPTGLNEAGATTLLASTDPTSRQRGRPTKTQQ